MSVAPEAANANPAVAPEHSAYTTHSHARSGTHARTKKHMLARTHARTYAPTRMNASTRTWRARAHTHPAPRLLGKLSPPHSDGRNRVGLPVGQGDGGRHRRQERAARRISPHAMRSRCARGGQAAVRHSPHGASQSSGLTLFCFKRPQLWHCASGFTTVPTRQNPLCVSYQRSPMSTFDKARIGLGLSSFDWGRRCQCHCYY